VSNSITVKCIDPEQGHKVLGSVVWPHLKTNLQAGKRMLVIVREETRSLEQNRRLWAMLTDISEQVEWYGRKLSPEDWKHVFSAALYQQDAVPGLSGGFVVLGKSTSNMTKAQMCEMQELMTAFGAERGVKFRAVEE